MSKYDDFMCYLTFGEGCDECPLYSNGFCTQELDKGEELSCDEILYRYLNEENKKWVSME